MSVRKRLQLSQKTGKMTSFSSVVKTEAGKELAKASTSTEPHWSDRCVKTFKSEESIIPACLLINSLTLK